MTLSPDLIGAVLSNGAGGVLLFVLMALVFCLMRGFLRTKFELDSWISRAQRAETQVDVVIPALNKQTDTVQSLSASVDRLSDRLR